MRFCRIFVLFGCFVVFVSSHWIPPISVNRVNSVTRLPQLSHDVAKASARGKRNLIMELQRFAIVQLVAELPRFLLDLKCHRRNRYGRFGNPGRHPIPACPCISSSLPFHGDPTIASRVLPRSVSCWTSRLPKNGENRCHPDGKSQNTTSTNTPRLPSSCGLGCLSVRSISEGPPSARRPLSLRLPQSYRQGGLAFRLPVRERIPYWLAIVSSIFAN